MTRRPRRRLSRAARVWVAVGGCAAGLFLVSGVIVVVERSRDTDLADARAGVTSRADTGVPADAPAIRLVDVALESGIDFEHAPASRLRRLTEDTGSGVAWGDVDADGDPDLYFVDLSGACGAAGNRLYRNDGGRFFDVTDAAGVRDLEGMGMAASFADYDDDGDLDIYVTNAGPNRLYRNRGDGTFEDVAAQAGVDDPSWSVGVTWGDFDRDGHVDLYVCNYVRYEGPAVTRLDASEQAGYIAPPALNPKVFDALPNRLFRNRGDGTFEDVAPALGVDDPRGRSLAATFADLDGDGRLDLYVNNDVSPNRLFLNRSVEGAPAFVDESTRTGTADPRGSMGLTVADLAGHDGPDGRADLFITHWIAQENALYEGFVTPAGTLVFRDRSRVLRLAELSLSAVGWGCGATDLDLDGRTDLVVVNGSTLEVERDVTRLRTQSGFVLWNDGHVFHDLSSIACEPLAAGLSARGLALADFDGDGDADIAVNVNRGRALLLRNDTVTAHRSLVVRLDAPAALAFGATVHVTVGARTESRWSGSDVSFASQHAPDLMFGLGDAEHVDQVVVRWADGTAESHRDLGPGVVTIRREH